MKAKLLTKSFTDDKKTVFCIYMTDDYRKFVVQWDRCEDDQFDLSLDVMSYDDGLTTRISDAIREGETDNNQDIDLYLCIRDKFNSNDCKALVGDYE